MSLPFFIAKNLYYGGTSVGKVSRPAVRIAMLGIAIGIATMIVTVSVVLGFKHAVRDKVTGFGSHIVVTNYLTYQTTDRSNCINANDSLLNAIRHIPGVRHAQRYSETQGVLKTDKDFLGVMFKGVDEGYDTTFLASNLVEGQIPCFSSVKTNRQLLISKTMAEKLRLSVGDKVFAYYIAGGESLRVRPFTVAGIYQSNFSKYDETLCFTDLYTVSRLNGWSITPADGEYNVMGIEVLINNFDSLSNVSERFICKINKTTDSDENPLVSANIKELVPQTFSWLDLLDLNVWVILVLMICVSSFTMVSGLLIIILERSATIGLLKALGASNSIVRRTFRLLSFFIILRGMAWGNLLGIGICLLQYYTGFITLDPTVYYVSQAPIEIDVPLLIALNVATLLLTMLAMVLPSTFVSSIHPARAMRVE